MIDMSSAAVAVAAAERTNTELAVFSVHARTEPGVMPRVLELFAKRGLVPEYWHSAVSEADRERLTIEIRMNGLAHDLVGYIAACMRQITAVEAVLTLSSGRGDRGPA
jgi:acetolactate synthase small subunit